MTRTKLQSIGRKQRYRYTATFVRFGEKNGYLDSEKTILLKNIKLLDTDEIITDHLWFTCGKLFEMLNLNSGDIIEFNARVGKYTKGWMSKRNWYERGCPPVQTDYKLEYPSKIKVVSRGGGSLAPPCPYNRCTLLHPHTVSTNTSIKTQWIIFSDKKG